MKDRHDRQGKTRRDFLKDVTMAGGGLAATAVLPGAAVAAVEPGEAPAGERQEEGYRLTEHVALYYETLKR